MDKVIKSKMQQKRGTAEEIASSTEVLLDGEIIYDKTNNKVKIGDGKTQIKDLPYLKGDGDFLPLVGGNMGEGAHIIMPGSDAGISVGSSSAGTMLLATGIQIVKNENMGISATMSTLPDYPNAFYLNGINTESMLLEGFEQIQLGLHNPIRISNVKDPVNDDDAANKAYVDNLTDGFLSLKGGTMDTDAQIISAGTSNYIRMVSSTNKNQYTYISPHSIALQGTQTNRSASLELNASKAGSEKFVISAFNTPICSCEGFRTFQIINDTDETLFTLTSSKANFNVPIEFSSGKGTISNLNEPSNDTDAVTKKYVDNAISNVMIRDIFSDESFTFISEKIGNLIKINVICNKIYSYNFSGILKGHNAEEYTMYKWSLTYDTFFTNYSFDYTSNNPNLSEVPIADRIDNINDGLEYSWSVVATAIGSKKINLNLRRKNHLDETLGSQEVYISAGTNLGTFYMIQS